MSARPERTNGATVPPHDLDAERQVLAGLLLFGPRHLAEVQRYVRSADDFYRPTHAFIYAAICHLVDAGAFPDPTAVAAQLKADGAAEPLTVAELSAISSDLSAEGAISTHAKAVADLAARRRLQGVCGEGWDTSANMSRPLAEIVAGLELKLAEVLPDHERGDLWPAGELARAVIDEARRTAERPDGLVGIPSGFTDLDVLTSGLRPGNLVLIGARTSMGKSAFAVGIAVQAALRDVPVLYASAEMTAVEIGRRMLAVVAEVPLAELERGRLDDRQWGRVHMAAEALAGTSLEVLAQPSPTVATVRAAAKAKRGRTGLGLLVVDYLQRLQLEEGERRDLTVGAAAWSFKALALELEVPVLLLSQLNRALEARANKHPQLADLRDSGQLEEHADVVALIYRDEVYDRDSVDKGIAEVLVEKNRHGPTGMVRLAFLEKQARFADLSTREPAF